MKEKSQPYEQNKAQLFCKAFVFGILVQKRLFSKFLVKCIYLYIEVNESWIGQFAR